MKKERFDLSHRARILDRGSRLHKLQAHFYQSFGNLCGCQPLGRQQPSKTSYAYFLLMFYKQQARS